MWIHCFLFYDKPSPLDTIWKGLLHIIIYMCSLGEATSLLHCSFIMCKLTMRALGIILRIIKCWENISYHCFMKFMFQKYNILNY